MIEKKSFGETDVEVYVKTPLEKIKDPLGLAGRGRRFESSLPPEDRLNPQDGMPDLKATFIPKFPLTNKTA